MQELVVVRVVLFLVGVVFGGTPQLWEVSPRTDWFRRLSLVVALKSPPCAPPLTLRRPAILVRMQFQATPHLPAVEALGFQVLSEIAREPAQVLE